jgi:hypothetical protein
MGRVNKLTEGVFTDIVGNQTVIPAYDKFLNVQDNLKKPSQELKKLTSQYKKEVTSNKTIFEKLAKLEDVIMQTRTRDNLSNDMIKLNIVREYIYARVPFHRNDKESKDVRVIVGLTEFNGEDVKVMYDNKEFMDKAKNKLVEAMNDIINQNLEILNKIN